MTCLIFNRNHELQDVVEFESDEQLEDFKTANPDLTVEIPQIEDEWLSEDDDNFYEELYED